MNHNTEKQRGGTLHRDKCQSKVRRTHTQKNGDVISLLGKHGFEWSVAIKAEGSCFLVITTFPDRQQATKEYKKLCR